MDEVVIKGKSYKAKFVNVHTLLKGQKLEEKMAKAVEKDDWALHTKLSLERTALFLEGDVSDLSPEKISPGDSMRLSDFFIERLAEDFPKSDSMSKTSLDSSVNTVEQEASPKDMI